MMSQDYRTLPEASPFQGRVLCPWVPAGIEIDLAEGTFFDIIATDNTVLVINAPINVPPALGLSVGIVISISNAVGGPMGNINFDEVSANGYRLGGASSKPANGKTRNYTFHFSGVCWHETTRVNADVNTT